ncbi:MAG: hypothetical protein NVS2B4_09050 [Ramlibacter sp.]
MNCYFVEGDVVRLRGSGTRAPAMSVQTISTDAENVICMWFDGSGALHEKSFHVRALEKITPSEGAAGSP